MRFRSEQHLRRQREIRAVRETGRRIDCRAFTIWWKFQEPPAVTGQAAAPALPRVTRSSRVCVIASTAAVGGAIRRNRAKRRLREVFRHQQSHLPAGCDLLLIARAAAIDWPLLELERRFTDACRQISPAATSPRID
jgi:ribonuclease P protein component